MEKSFRFTNDKLRTIPFITGDKTASHSLELSDQAEPGLKILIGKTTRSFLLRFRAPDSRKRSITLGRFPDIDVATARKMARKIKTQIAEGADPKAERERAREIPTLSEFFWNTYLPLATKRKSVKDDIQRFKDYIEPSLGSTRYTDLTAAQIQKLQLTLNSPTRKRKAYAPATCNRALAILKTMGNHAVRLGITNHNEALKIPLLRENNVRTRFLNIEEAKRVISEARTYPIKPVGGLIALLLISGCRSSELRYATKKDLDKKSRIITIPPERTKNRKGRIVYLSDLAMEIIEELPTEPDNPYLFIGRRPGQPVKDGRIALRKILANAGIDNPKELCFHSLRHSAASNLVEAGFTISDVQSHLGHLCSTSSQRYIKHSITRRKHTGDKMAELLSTQ